MAGDREITSFVMISRTSKRLTPFLGPSIPAIAALGQPNANRLANCADCCSGFPPQRAIRTGTGKRAQDPLVNAPKEVRAAYGQIARPSPRLCLPAANRRLPQAFGSSLHRPALPYALFRSTGIVATATQTPKSGRERISWTRAIQWDCPRLGIRSRPDRHSSW
jgi:hypothetical protein